MNTRAYLLNWLVAALAILMVLGSAVYLEESYVDQLRQNRELETQARVAEVGARIESVLQSNIASMQGFASYLSIRPDISAYDFADTAHLFLNHNPLVDRVYRVTSDLAYSHRYPADADGSVAAGAFLDNGSREEVLALQALRNAQMTLSEPFLSAEGQDLLQVWLPLQKAPLGWPESLLFFPVSLNLLFENAGLQRLLKEMDIAIRVVTDGRPGTVFFGLGSLFSTADITYSLDMPGMQWQIAAEHRRESFVERSSRLWIQLVAFFLIGVVFLVLWLRLKELHSVGLVERQQFMLDQAQRVGRIGNWSWNVAKNEVFWSDEAYRLFGVEKGDATLRGKGYLKFIHDEDRAHVEATLEDAMQRGGRYQSDFRLLRSGFDQRWVHSEGFVELSQDRKPVRVFGIFQDVTASRRIERELKQREAQLSAITDAAQSLIMITRVSDGYVYFCNPSSRRLLGVDPQALIGRSIIDLYPNPDDRKTLLSQVERQQFLSNYKLVLRRADDQRLVSFLIGLQKIHYQGEDCFVVDMVDISNMLQAQAALAESEEKFRLFAEHIPGVFWLSSPDGRSVEFLSRGYESITGYPVADVLSGSRALFAGVMPEDRRLLEEQMFCVSDKPVQLEFRIQTPDGDIRWMRNLSFATHDDSGKVKNIAGFGEDITAAYLSKQRQKLAASVFDNTAEAIVVTDARNKIVSVNTAFCRITGYTSDEVVGANPSILSSGQQSPEFYSAMWQSLVQAGYWQGEVWNRKKNGELYVEWLSITALRNRFDEVENYVAVFSDITDRKEKEELIRYQANYDALTGLPNRVLFNDRLTQAISSSKRYQAVRGALMFIDLDHFKEVNDTLGHEAGDQLLTMVAERLKGQTRESDTVARLGGDEFTVMLPAIESAKDVGQVADKIIAALSRSFDLNGKSAHISASVGITLFPDDGTELTRILQNADQAMYAAKAAGRRTYRYFTPQMQQEAEQRQLLQNDLRAAISNEEFELHYQPIVNQQGRVVKTEALVRWNHPQQGRIPPDQFIALAEETGLIIQLGGWVFRKAVSDLARLYPHYPQLSMAVNLSSKQISTDEAHVERFIDLLQEYGLPPQQVTLEVTESLFLDPGGASVDKLTALRAQGFEIAIDDFGTGYSSLSYLKQLPLTTIKIDKSFVCDLDKDNGDKVLVDAILSIARSMHLNVIAEGVETQGQADYLVDKGTQMLQGWLYGRPMPFDELASWLENNVR